MKEMVKEAIDLMDNGAITFQEEDEEYDTMVSAMSKQVDTMIIHGKTWFNLKTYQFVTIIVYYSNLVLHSVVDTLEKCLLTPYIRIYLHLLG